MFLFAEANLTLRVRCGVFILHERRGWLALAFFVLAGDFPRIFHSSGGKGAGGEGDLGSLNLGFRAGGVRVTLFAIFICRLRFFSYLAGPAF